MDTFDAKSRRIALGCLATLALVAAGFVAFGAYAREDIGWALVGLAFLLSLWWQRGIRLDGDVHEGRVGPSSWPRWIAGAILAGCGTFLWVRGSISLEADWRTSFDQTWILWFAGTALLGLGLDRLAGRWRLPARPNRWRIAAMVAGLVLVAASTRLGTFYFFPAPYHLTQVEELQVGALAGEVLSGLRLRWEYLSQAWLGALGLTLGGPSLLSVRLPSTVISFCKLVPFFFWMRFAAGNSGAIVAALLLAISGWDSTFARVATNHNVFVVATAFALLTGPARRGRPSAYVWLGLFSGYVMFEYVLYRPLALFAIVGAVLTSLRQRHSHWLTRLARPALTLALFLAMAWPLYSYVTRSGRTREFFDGYGRATANTAYYSAGDTWQQLLAKRLERAELAVSLFFFHGPDSPVANPRAVPLTDPFTAGLLLLGVGYAVAHPLRGLFGLTLGGCLVTLTGALIITGNFDFVRAGSAVGYLFALVGFGAASVVQALRGLDRAWGRRLAAGILGAGVLYAGVVNGRYLWFFVHSPEIAQAQFRDLAYLSWWIYHNVSDDVPIVIVAPNFPYLMENNDASWMRGAHKRGVSLWDLQSGLKHWALHPEKAVWMIYGRSTSRDTLAYLAWLLPGVHFDLEPGPLGAEHDLLFARAVSPPPELAPRLERWDCQPVKVRADLMDDSGKILETVHGTAGLIDPTQWPASIQVAFQRLRPQTKQIRVRFSGSFQVKHEGQYVFPFEIFPGSGSLAIDGKVLQYPPSSGVVLRAGTHQVELVSQYDPNASSPHHRLFWEGPDSDGQSELLPFYRLAPESCPVAEPEAAPAAAPS